MGASEEQMGEWRAKAAEFRLLADQATYSHLRKAYVEMADSYDRLVAAEEHFRKLQG